MIPRQWWRSDAVLALLIGCAGALLSLVLYTGAQADIDNLLSGGRLLLAGKDPYRGVESFFYPLPVAIVFAPLSGLSPALARAAFSGISFGTLSYAIVRTGWHRFPMLFCWPVLACIQLGQLGPLLVAGYLLPWLAWIWVIKPNMALPFLAARPRPGHLFAGAIGGAALLAASFAIQPGWLGEWLHHLGRGLGVWFEPPILNPFGGPLLALALLGWRDPDARLLLVLALVPQTQWLYNATAVFLVTRTVREATVLTALGWIAAGAGVAVLRFGLEAFQAVSIFLFYLPALWMVLRRGAAATRPTAPGMVGAMVRPHGGAARPANLEERRAP